MTAPPVPVGATPRRSATSRVAWIAAAWVAPLAGAAATLRWLVPSPMDGGSRRPLAVVAWLGDEHLLALGVALGLVYAAVARHWWSQLELPTAARARADGDRLRGPRFWVVLAAVSLAALLVRGALVEVTRVASASMVPTLDVRDRVLVNRLAYGVEVPFVRRRIAARSPRRGDVVVFPGDARPLDDTRVPGEPRTLVKRVLGLPGDVVSFNHGAASINGWPVPVCDAGPFVSTAGATTIRGRLVVEFLGDASYLTVREPANESTFASFDVPAGHVFVVGDARDVSRDSRSWSHGRGAAIPIASVEGRVTRFAVGAARDGRLDLASVLAPLRPAVREPDVDLRATAANIAECLRRRPATTEPPSPPPGARP